MKHHTAFFLLLFTVCLKVPAAELAEDLKSMPLGELAQAYRALRAIPGKFDGAAWNPQVDRWQGDKHRVMLTLGERIIKEYGKLTDNDLNDLLGAPDLETYPGDQWYAIIAGMPEYQTVQPAKVYLLYFWRTGHDLLFFASRNNKIMRSGWWHAFE